MIPPAASSDPDPTTQIPWPATRSRDQPPLSVDALINNDATGSNLTNTTSGRRSTSPQEKRNLSLWDLFTLSVSMAGAQITWTVELGYGTPYLLDLGLSEQYTSLVWLAGPISGLVAQPVIGALSDSSTSKYRRRFWVLASTGALVFSMLNLAYSKPLGVFIVDLLAVGAGDWDEKRKEMARKIAIVIAVIAFYILDFALNGLQASLRNLLLDVTPPGQLNAANAWHGRMINAGSVIGFGFGFLKLTNVPFIKHLGGQFTIFCLITTVILVGTVLITCFSHEEEARAESHTTRNSRDLRSVFKNIRGVLMTLPKPIRRVCYVQLLAWMGWFPFLFFATTYMGQVMAAELGREPDHELATRKGEFAMAIYSIVAVIAGIILPRFATRDLRLMGHRSDVDEDAELSRLRAMVRQWRVEAAQRGRDLHLPVMPFLLRNIWTGALVFFSLLMFSTFFITTTFQATIFISSLGVCWAVAMWVPFTIIMELLKEPPPKRNDLDTRRPSHSRNLSTPGHRPSFTGLTERQPLLRRRSFDEYAYNPDEEDIPQAPSTGGTILGIHNLAIVIPQFIIALVTSFIFRVIDGPSGTKLQENEDQYFGKHGVGWALRFGGACAILAALMARRVPPTPTEKAMRRRLGEMKLLGEESNS